MNRFVRLPSPALVIACIALFVSLGGATYAAVKLPRGSVGTPQLKKNAVTSIKLKKDAVTSIKVKNGTLLRSDFKNGELPNGAEGPAGGDLEGSYPSPTIAANAVEGANVVDGSLTAADIGTSFVSGPGVRRTSDGFISADTSADIVVPNAGTMRVSCGMAAGSGSATWIHLLGANYQFAVYEAGTEGGVPTYGGEQLSGGSSAFTTFADSASSDVGRRAEFQMVTNGGAPVVTATVSLITHPGGLTSSCFYAMDVLSGA